MIIKRIRIANVRRFVAPVEILGLGQGIMEFEGPNESGKSSMVRAIKAVFHERHRSNGAEDLRPKTGATGGPEVEVEFEIAGKAYKLRQRFLEGKRCELEIGPGNTLLGDEAEDHLSSLLGYTYAGKGPSKPEHQGVPGLLWVEQGTTQTIVEAVSNAKDQLRSALQGEVAQVASSTGDEILRGVEKERSALLTPKGKPTGTYLAALDQKEQTEREASDLRNRLQEYRDLVDRLGLLTGEIRQGEQERPWEDLRRKALEAREKLQEIEQSEKERDRLTDGLATLENLIQQFRQRTTEAEQTAKDLEDREQLLDTNLESLERSEKEQKTRVEKLALLKKAQEEASSTLELASQEELRRSLDEQQKELGVKTSTLNAAIKGAEQAQMEATRLEGLITRNQMDPKDLARLRNQVQSLRELEIRLEASATRLDFSLIDGGRVSLAGDPLTGDGSLLLVQPTRIEVEGIGNLTITPGGTDLDSLTKEQKDLELQRQNLLRRLGVPDLEEAEARDVRARDAIAKKEHQESIRDLHAPEGVEVLKENQVQVAEQMLKVQVQLASLPAAPTVPPPSPKQATKSYKDAERAFNDEKLKVEELKDALIQSRADLEAERKDIARLKARISSEEYLLDLQATRDQLEDAQLEALNKGGAKQALERKIQEAQPKLLQQDFDRLERSANQVESIHQNRKRDLLELQTRLEEKGGQGIEEALAAKEADAERAHLRAVDLERRAKALDLLLNLLQEKRQDLTRRLLAPLKAKIDHYLGLLFAGAELEVGEDLAPTGLIRIASGGGKQHMPLDDLSFGSREQIGLICRLAYADLLKEVGRPTLIILDDALVHSDAARLGHMKRVLYDAATRHQILLFTCHPKAWEDLGAEVRTMESLTQAVSA